MMVSSVVNMNESHPVLSSRLPFHRLIALSDKAAFYVPLFGKNHMAEKRMTKLNPLIKPPNPLDLEDNIFIPEDEESFPREQQLEQLKKEPKRTLRLVKRWLRES